MFRTRTTTSQSRNFSRAALLALGLLLGLGAAAPAAAWPDADSEPPNWAAPRSRLGELIVRLLGGGSSGSHGLAADGQMDSNRLTASRDHGPDIDPDRLTAGGGDDGPDMDPDGLSAGADDGPDIDPEGDDGPDMDPDG